MKKNLVFAVVGIAAMGITGQVQAAPMNWSSTTPSVGAGVVNTAIAATWVDDMIDTASYVALDNPRRQGQTFTTGSNAAGYNLTAVSLKQVAYETWADLNTTGVFKLNVVSVNGTSINTIYSDNNVNSSSAFSMLPANGSGKWCTIALGQSVHLDANKVYGFDLTAWGSTVFFKTAGTAADSYTGGSAYTIGLSPTAVDGPTSANGVFTTYAGDHAFAATMTPAVPEPGSIVAMLSGLMGFAGFGIRRKK